MKLSFVTSNPGKFGEAKNTLEPLGVELERLDTTYPEIQADTLEEVAEYGLEIVSMMHDSAVMLEDAGLFVDALDDFPGVYSAYVFGTLGHEGILKLLEGTDDRKARFEACIALKLPGEPARFFKGVCPGQITKEARGSGGFGFDPIFVPEGEMRTFAEMSIEEKGALSHRGKAMMALGEWLRKTKYAKKRKAAESIS